jgi:signal transduction histidine kinase
LAFDLHDTLVQTIVASYQHLQTAQGWRGRDPSREERELDQGVHLLQQAIYEARRLIAQLRPAGLDDFGLVHALRLYVAQLAAESDWQIDLEIAPQWAKLPPALEAALFRIVQEATNNAKKYAGAQRVRVSLDVSNGRLCVTVRDWGKGFDPTQVPVKPQHGLHMGLIGIRERARMWGGTCDIESEPGEGTVIRVQIPRADELWQGGEV